MLRGRRADNHAATLGRGVEVVKTVVCRLCSRGGANGEHGLGCGKISARVARLDCHTVCRDGGNRHQLRAGIACPNSNLLANVDDAPQVLVSRQRVGCELRCARSALDGVRDAAANSAGRGDGPHTRFVQRQERQSRQERLDRHNLGTTGQRAGVSCIDGDRIGRNGRDSHELCALRARAHSDLVAYSQHAQARSHVLVDKERRRHAGCDRTGHARGTLDRIDGSQRTNILAERNGPLEAVRCGADTANLDLLRRERKISARVAGGHGDGRRANGGDGHQIVAGGTRADSNAVADGDLRANARAGHVHVHCEHVTAERGGARGTTHRGQLFARNGERAGIDEVTECRLHLGGSTVVLQRDRGLTSVRKGERAIRVETNGVDNTHLLDLADSEACGSRGPLELVRRNAVAVRRRRRESECNLVARYSSGRGNGRGVRGLAHLMLQGEHAESTRTALRGRAAGVLVRAGPVALAKHVVGGNARVVRYAAGKALKHMLAAGRRALGSFFDSSGDSRA